MDFPLLCFGLPEGIRRVWAPSHKKTHRFYVIEPSGGLGCSTLIVACFIDAGVRVAYVASLGSLWVALTFVSLQ